VLELSRLRKTFGDVVALDDVSITVGEGRIVGFVGRNGAGKTTAMRIALGVLLADAGDVRWRGAPVDAIARRRFGYMPEERGLYPKMRVHEQLVYLARLHGLTKADGAARADELFARLGVLAKPTDRVESLSLGNQQRVQLAAALVHRPEVLVLDEPFSGLDPTGVDLLGGVLAGEARERGAAVLFSSHQLELVERMCDEVVLIERGRVVAAGPIDELRASRARRLLRVEVVGAAEDWFEAVPGVRRDDRTGGADILALDDGADAQRVLDVARAQGEVRSFGPVEKSLAELFREVVEEHDEVPA
jgi:ABC-2 type transport system ATP-binding protein